MKIFWILLIILGLIILNSKTIREKIKSLFRKLKSGSSSSSSKNSQKQKYEDEWNKKHTHKYSTNYEKYYDDFNKKTDKSYINILYTEIKEDFINAYYSDKFIISDPRITAGYIFENNRIIKLYADGRIEDSLHGTKTLSYTNVSHLMMFFASLAQMAKRRPADSSFRGGSSKANNFYYTYTTADNTKYTKEQLEYQAKFRKLKENHDARMTQLNGMDKKDPNRPALVNEVNVVKRKMKIYYEKSGLKNN
jgi:hypothetical protein